MNDNPNPNNYVLRTDRTQTLQTMMDRISKAFTHCAEGAGINKNVSLRHLRKTYITCVNQALGFKTRKLTSQTEGGEAILYRSQGGIIGGKSCVGG